MLFQHNHVFYWSKKIVKTIILLYFHCEALIVLCDNWWLPTLINSHPRLTRPLLTSYRLHCLARFPYWCLHWSSALNVTPGYVVGRGILKSLWVSFKHRLLDVLKLGQVWFLYGKDLRGYQLICGCEKMWEWQTIGLKFIVEKQKVFKG